MKRNIELTYVLLTDYEKIDITDCKIVSRTDLLCQEMEVRVGRGQGRRGRSIANT